jgi:hypothetical protein
MKKILIVVGAILLAGLIAAGSFWGGMAYQIKQAEQVRASFMNARGIANDGQLPNGGQGAMNGQLPGGGQAPGMFGGSNGTVGQVKTIEGNVMTVSTAQDVATVNLSDTTQIEKTVSGVVNDLQPGVRVMVTGQKDANGNITADQIQILNDNGFNPLTDLQSPYPSPTQTEP